jgi:NAD(P)-dependent dehydrogenase (short-subunit alcohol dehydrogenase family)
VSAVLPAEPEKFMGAATGVSKNIVVVGASSGIGLELTKELLKSGNKVWGLARHVEALRSCAESHGNQGALLSSEIDISRKETIVAFAHELRDAGFMPDVVVINAGIYQNDMDRNVSSEITRELMDTNCMGAIYCVQELLPLVAQNGQFIAISSSSAFKGSGYEGAGYAASKAALSVSFESFYLKWSRTGPMFTTVFFGPLETSLRRTKGSTVFLTSAQDAAACVMKAIRGRKPVYYCPALLFLCLRLAKILPSGIYLHLLRRIESKMQ